MAEQIQKKKLAPFVLILLLPLLMGCGYQFANGGQCHSVTVPYAIGDTDGGLTSEVVKYLSTSGSYRYVQDGGDFVLKIRILDFRDKNIGFRYDVDSKGCRLNSIIPAETRTSIVVEIELVEANSCRCVIGPARLSASVDYDHEYYSSPNGVNVFSLGQLSDSYEARDAAVIPLNAAIAQKIVDYINNSW